MTLGGLAKKLGFGAVTVSAACSSKPAEQPDAPTASATALPVEPPPGPPEPEPVETGHACATATSLCTGGACTVDFKNDCDNALTCEASMVLRCRTPTELVEAYGRGRQTFPGKNRAELVVTANCTMGDLVQTNFGELKCR